MRRFPVLVLVIMLVMSLAVVTQSTRASDCEATATPIYLDAWPYITHSLVLYIPISQDYYDDITFITFKDLNVTSMLLNYVQGSDEYSISLWLPTRWVAKQVLDNGWDDFSNGFEWKVRYNC